LILLHAQGRDRTAWSAFAQRAHAQGYRVYVPDMPGHGDSVCGGRAFRDFAPQDWQALEGVVTELVTHAIENGADPENVFVAGAGIGANLALRAALGDARIQAVVLVSPGRDYLGVTLPPLTEETRSVPMLLVAAEGDSYAAAAAESLHAAAPGYAELRMRAGAASGTDLLDASADTSALTLRWLQDILE